MAGDAARTFLDIVGPAAGAVSPAAGQIARTVGETIGAQNLAGEAAGSGETGELPSPEPGSSGMVAKEAGVDPAASAAAAGPMVIPTQTMSSTTQSPAFDPRLLPQAQQLQQQEETNAVLQAEAQAKSVESRRNVIDRLNERLAEDQVRYGSQAGALYRQMEQASGELARMQEEIDSFEPDPDRTWGSMTGTQNAIATIAMAFSHYSQMGAQGAVNVIDKVIDRDLAIQRDRVRRLANKARLTAARRSELWQQWFQVEQQKKGIAHRMAQMELMRAALDQDTIDARAKAAEVVLASRRRMLDLQNASRARSSTTVSRGQKILMPKAGSKGDKPDKKYLAEHAKMVGTVRKMDAIRGEIARLAGKDQMGRLRRIVPGTEANRILQAQLIPLIVNIARTYENDRLTDADFIRYKNMLDPRISGVPTISGDEVVRRIDMLRNDVLREMKARLDVQGQYSDVKPLSASYNELLGPQAGTSPSREGLRIRGAQ